MPDMCAEVLIRIHGVAATHYEAAKGPVTITDFKLATAWVVEFLEITDLDFLL